MKRGRIVASLLALALLGAAAFVVLFVGGRSGLGPARSATPGTESPTSSPAPPPTICPLSDLPAEGGAIPERPALAVKVENLPAARPQTGLSWADIVYEEPVEALITRFIAVYQCQDASRIEPVRSARLTDPDILVQFGTPLFAYAGGVPKVRDAVERAGLIDVNYNVPAAANAYERDPERLAPHNLVSSTQGLYAAAGNPTGSPDPIFKYAKKKPRPRGEPVSEIHLPFSPESDVYWRWDGGSERFLRWHGEVPHTLSDGTQVSTTNVIVQVVKLTFGDIKDVNGVRSPEVVSVGSGPAYVLRDGRIVTGKWIRPSLDDVTRFEDDKGRQIKLLPGQTWVELFPDTLPVTYS